MDGSWQLLKSMLQHVKTVIEFGDSDALKRGETVIAIGNPLGLGFSGSVTLGVVSGKDRSIPMDFDNNGVVDWYADVLQTDAAINPGTRRCTHQSGRSAHWHQLHENLRSDS